MVTHRDISSCLLLPDPRKSHAPFAKKNVKNVKKNHNFHLITFLVFLQMEKGSRNKLEKLKGRERQRTSAHKPRGRA